MYFTDDEYRLLLCALGREMKVCKEVDKETTREPYEKTLEYKINCIEKKIKKIQYVE